MKNEKNGSMKQYIDDGIKACGLTLALISVATTRYSSQWMKYKPADNMTADFPDTYEIFIGLSQCCDNTNCWYYGGPGLSETIETASSRKYLNISIMLLSLCVMITLAHISFDDSVLPFNHLRAAKVMFSKWIQTILVIISILFTAASTVNTPLINSKKALWNRNCESICHSVTLSPAGSYERVGRGAKFCAKSDDGAIKLMYFQFSGASINFFLIFAAFLFELVTCISSIVFNIKSMKDNKIKAKVKPEEKKESPQEEKLDEKSSKEKPEGDEAQKEIEETPKEEKKDEKTQENQEEPRVKRRMVEKPKDGFENPEMYKKHEPTEAEKKQNWLENRLGNMVKEEGDAEDLNAAAEVVSKTPDQKPKSPSNESPELELKNYPIEKIEEVTEPGTTDSEGRQMEDITVLYHHIPKKARDRASFMFNRKEAERIEKATLGLISSDEDEVDKQNKKDWVRKHKKAKKSRRRSSTSSSSSSSSSSSDSSDSEVDYPSGRRSRSKKSKKQRKKEKKRKKKEKKKAAARKKRVKENFQKVRRRTIDLIDKNLLMAAVFGREIRDNGTKFKELRRIISAPLLIGDYSGVSLARPPTPMDPKNELLRHLIYPAPKRKNDQLTSQLSFEFFETAKYFRRTSRKLIKRLSQPSLKEMKKLKPESLEKLKKFSIILQKRKRAGPSPSGSFDSVISLDGLFGDDDPLLLRPRKRVKKRVTKRISTFNLGLIFGSENSPTYSQVESPIESFNVSTEIPVSTRSSFSTPCLSRGNTLSDLSDTCFEENLSVSSSTPTKSPTPPPPRTPTPPEDPTLFGNFHAKKLIKRWNSRAKFQGFVRRAPVPAPPYSQFFGMKGGQVEPITPKKAKPYQYSTHLLDRKNTAAELNNGRLFSRESFISTVDSSSIYDNSEKDKIRETRLIHILDGKLNRPDDFTSPEMLPEHIMSQKKRVAQIQIRVQNNQSLLVDDPTYFELLASDKKTINWKPAPVETIAPTIEIENDHNHKRTTVNSKCGYNDENQNYLEDGENSSNHHQDGQYDPNSAVKLNPNDTLLFMQNELNRRRRRSPRICSPRESS